MKNKLYLMTTFRDIKQSFGRFIAVILIILMGTLLFVGIKSVGPNLEVTVDRMIQKNKLSDIQIIGTTGLTKTDQKLAEKVPGAKTELGYSFPYTEAKQRLDLQVYSYADDANQNQLIVKRGYLPKRAQEVVVDQSLQKKYPLDSTLAIKNDQLKHTNFKVVGFVDSPIYVDKAERGSTTVGDGKLDGFVYLPKSEFKSGPYSILYVRFTDLAKKSFFASDYEKQLTKKTQQLETLFKTRKKERKTELTADTNKQLQDQEQSLTQNEQQLTTAQTQLNAAKAQLDQQKAQAQQAGALPDALQTAEQELSDQQQTLTNNQHKLAEGKRKLATAKAEVADLQPNYLLNDRKSNPGFNEYTSLSDRIDAIGNVFPVFFFLIAILITFTTITRMIEENRKEIGTLKSLGYRSFEIATKYLLYAGLTAVIGTGLGVIIGTKFLPAVVFSMLQKNFIFTDYPTDFWAVPILIAILAAGVATLGSTAYVLIKDLREKPTTLLQPKTPKAGKRVLLERITPIWQKMNFNQKVTYRNLSRYKARMILTILGIAGCAGLMIAGFGLQSSISGAADKQFHELNHYQAIVSLADGKDADSPLKAKKVIRAQSKVTDYQALYSDQVKFKQKNSADQSASLYAIKDTKQLAHYFTLNAVDNTSANLTDHGALISEGLANAYQVKAGDQLTFQTSTGQSYQLKVSGIVENYLGHTVFMTLPYLDHVTASQNRENTYLLKTKSMSNQAEKQLANDLSDTNEVVNTTFISDQMTKQGVASTNLQPVILIFIVLSATLAFVVLYNLTNINISERERELATIKVLGFFDNEVTMYIVRESVIFTILGILVGFGVGKLLTWFIITMAGSEMMRFPLIIPPVGYVVASGLTILFSVIVMGITHQKLKQIDMIGALKSNE